VILEAHPSAPRVETLPLHVARRTRFRRFPHATRPASLVRHQIGNVANFDEKNLETLPNQRSLSAEAESNVNTCV
jgi:hypothetical protein